MVERRRSRVADEYIKFCPEHVSLQQDSSRFFIRVDKYEAVLEYAETAPGVLDLYYTDVPVPIQGRGLGKMLAVAAFDYVVAQDYRMILTCSHLKKYFKDNPKPEYRVRVILWNS